MAWLSWMAYSTVVGTAAAAAALLVERLLRGRHCPARLAWVGAFLVTVSLSALALLTPEGAASAAGGVGRGQLLDGVGPGGDMSAFGVVSVMGALWRAGASALDPVMRGLGPLAPGLWLASSGLLLTALILSAVRLRERLSRWRPTTLQGVEVRISHDTGPAVVGVLAPAIVLPSWVLDEDAAAQAMILRHELEHLHARDPWLMLAAYLVVVAAPWNPALWWQFRRLRDATEVDCDRRVLGTCTAGQRRQYGALLVRVARHLRSGAPRPALAAFAERGTALERRIRTMLHLLPPLSYKQRAAAGLGSAALLALACTLPGPTAPSDADVAEAPLAEVTDEAQAPAATPTFTPFTQSPEIANRAVVQQKLVDEYPPLLRNAGLGGTAKIWFHIDQQGRVTDTRLSEGSGHPALDEAALRVAAAMEFTPALNRDRAVPVWVEFPITFQVR